MIKWFNSILWGQQQDDIANPEKTRNKPLICTENGILYVALGSDSGASSFITPESDNRSNSDLEGFAVSNAGHLFNGSGWDRERANTTETILASAARTTTTNSADFTNYNARGAHFFIDVTAVTATPSITVNIQGKDPVSGTYYNLLTSVAITTVSTAVLKLYPGIGAVANAAAADILPRTYRVSVTHADADSITYSVGASLVV